MMEYIQNHYDDALILQKSLPMSNVVLIFHINNLNPYK